MQEIIEARQQGGAFSSLDDFCERVDLRRINRRMLECLIKVGALDRFGLRADLLATVDQMMALSIQVHEAQDVGQMTMFDMMAPEAASATGLVLIKADPIPNKVQLGWEKELVGFYVSEHPLTQVALTLKEQVTCYCGQVTEEMNGQNVALAGIVSWVRPHVTRKGDLMAFVHLEDLQGSIEVVVFPRTYAATRDLWQEDKILIVRGRIDAERREPSLICESVSDHIVRPLLLNGESADPPTEAEVSEPVAPEAKVTSTERSGNGGDGTQRADLPRHLRITIERSGNHEQDKRRIGEVYGLLEQRPGPDQFTFLLVDGKRQVQIDFPNTTTSYSHDLAQSLQTMLGRDALQVTRGRPNP
jgi:DNA polymerase-3 subunit alpha